jgi:hypothetical protein
MDDDGTVVHLHQEELSNALVLLVLDQAGRETLRLVGGRLLASPPLLFQLQKICQCIDERNYKVIIEGIVDSESAERSLSESLLEQLFHFCGKANVG